MPLTATIAPARSSAARLRDGVPARLRGGRRATAAPAARRPGTRSAGRGSAGRRVVVLAPARGAHRERGHRRQRPVVGDAAHDREARAAVRAVDERVAVAPVAGVEAARPGSPSQVAASAVTSATGAPAGRARRSRSRVAAAGRDVDARGRPRRGPAAARRSRRRGEEALDRVGAGPRPRSRRRARRCGRSRRARSSAARRWTNGRNPTPCTTPSTRTRARRSPCRGRGPDQRPVHHPRPARAARATRWPAPPGCAGCARSG